mmetsp:Transcript_5384/g.14991  ORF Transcript_5384/g.14991 Transcript_5384/m.14991 type:complete len:194 (-) Transcript_5384:628-1209(-)
MGDLGVGPPPLLHVEKAKSSRSRCKACQKHLSLGENRFGLQCWMAGRTMVGWVHPKCLIPTFAFDVAPSGRGKCKYTGEPFSKGELRFCLCNYLKTYVKLSAVDKLLAEASLHFEDFRLDQADGYEELDSEQRKEVADALPCFPYVTGQPGQASATRSRAADAGGRKRKAAAAPVEVAKGKAQTSKKKKGKKA